MKYSALDIDRLRRLIRYKISIQNHTYYVEVKSEQVERELLTLMSNETNVDEMKEYVLALFKADADDNFFPYVAAIEIV